ncbi:hypothetical protein Droror1_Dr00008918 [Drosera rotundifolia]
MFHVFCSMPSKTLLFLIQKTKVYVSGMQQRGQESRPFAESMIVSGFWILAAHPEMNLLAAGHDSGMVMFKLERERPAISVSGDPMFFVKDRFLRSFEFSTQKDNQIIPIHRSGSASLDQCSRSLSYVSTENAVLICSDAYGESYELYVIPKDNCGKM